jgi:hypothetical protein
MRLRWGLAVLPALMAGSGPAFAGAWTLPEGTGQIVTTFAASQATESFGGDWSLRGTPRYTKIEAEPLIEYGASDRLTIMLGPGFQHVDIATPVGASRTGLGYSEIGARYGFWQDNDWVLSGQTLLRIPGTSDRGNPAAIGYTGVEIDMRALAGKSFSVAGKPAFVDLEVAQRFRGDGAPDEFRADFTFGVRPADRWLLLLQNFNVVSEGAGPPVFPSYNYHKLQMSAVYELTPQWAVQLGGFTTFAGRNALQENGLVLGLWRKF